MIFTNSLRAATSLANLGQSEAAIVALGDRWPGVGVEPPRNGDSDLDYAKLLLVCGILTIEVGRFTLTPAQASAKDLLSKSVRLFGEDPDRLLAQYWLGWAYLFSGENREALALAESVLAEQTADSDVVFRSGRLKGLAYLNLGDFGEAEAAFASVEVFLNTAPPLSRGKFYLNRGMLFRQAGRLEESLSDHQSACECFRLARDVRHQAAAINNVAGVYTDMGRFAEARQAAEAALSVFVQLKDRAHEAKVSDQIAQIYGREKNFAEMERCASRAVEILSAGNHDGWLAEALITLGTARARLGMKQAQESLSRALEICDRQGDPKQAGAVTMAMWDIVRRGSDARDAIGAELSSLERGVYERVLEQHDGHVSPAAHLLGYSHQALQRRLQNHFPDLLTKRRPPRKRHKSVLKTTQT